MKDRFVNSICKGCKIIITVEIPVGYHAICEKCSEHLHSCNHCRHFDTTKNKCTAQVAEKPKDPRLKNFCDEFSISEKPNVNLSDQDQSDKTINKLENLFKKSNNNTEEPKKKKSINDLFKD